MGSIPVLLAAAALALRLQGSHGVAWGAPRARLLALRPGTSGLRRPALSLAEKKDEDEQTVTDLNLEEMFEVFDAAEKSVADEDTAKAPAMAKAAKPVEDDDEEENSDSLDIVKRVRPRDDWWSDSALASPLAGVAKGVEDDPLDKFILESPLPSGAFLGIATVFAISFVGCIFQLFYDKPAAPVLGVPATIAVFVISGPTFLFSFIAAIKKGNAETADDWK